MATTCSEQPRYGNTPQEEAENLPQPSGGTTLSQGQVGGETPVKDICDELRVDIKRIGERAKFLMDHKVFYGEQAYSGQHGEMKANIMLTYRHLEDARMRVGKILQAAGDGVSILDKPK